MMIRRMRYGAAILAMAWAMAVVMPAQMLTAFAASAKIAFSDPSATVGSQVKVNMKITSSSNLASADVMLAYDSNALEFVEGTNADGGAGAVRVHGDAGTPNTGTLAFSLTFNARAAGSSKITITSQEIYDSNSQLVTVDHEGSAAVTISALKTASKDATLKSLRVSPGELTPAFSADVDTYAVTVGTDVEKVLISAEPTDENANFIVTGSDGLQMGENRVTCKVTAQDGETSKEYVIVVTKAEGGASAASADPSSSVKMEISRRVLTILPPDDSVEVPKGFKATTINIDGHKVQGWVWGAETEHQYCVVYGMNEAGEKNFYRYDMKDSERTLQRYFEDPAMSDMVDKEIYNKLATEYDNVCDDFSLFRILLIVTVVIAVVLLIILLVVIMNKKGKGGGPGGDGDIRAERGSRARGAAKQKQAALEDADDTAYEEEDDYSDDGLYEEEDGFPDQYGEPENDDDYPELEDLDSDEDSYQTEYEEEYEAARSHAHIDEPAPRAPRHPAPGPADRASANRAPAPADRPREEKADKPVDDDFEIFDL